MAPDNKPIFNLNQWLEQTNDALTAIAHILNPLTAGAAYIRDFIFY